MAHKFKMRLKLEGLELEIEGTKDDVPLITQAVGQGIAGMLGTGANIVDAEVEVIEPTPAPAIPDKKPSKPRSAAKRSKTNSTTQDQSNTVLTWTHAPDKWGRPKQSWTTAFKSLWLMYVLSDALKVKEFTTTQITNTFNANFKEAKEIWAKNVARDLGKLAKDRQTPFVSEAIGKSPVTWYLTEAGALRAKELVKEALTPTQESD